eukprot:12167979-Karenia_brevis.AAC.1
MKFLPCNGNIKNAIIARTFQPRKAYSVDVGMDWQRGKIVASVKAAFSGQEFLQVNHNTKRTLRAAELKRAIQLWGTATNAFSENTHIDLVHGHVLKKGRAVIYKPSPPNFKKKFVPVRRLICKTDP